MAATSNRSSGRLSSQALRSKIPFEAVREDVTEQTTHDLQRGSVFYDLHCNAPYRLDFVAASIKDGSNHELHRRIFVVQALVPLAHRMGEG